MEQPTRAGTLIVIAVTQAFRRLICRVLIGVFVSAQFAIAAYACPGVSESITTEAAVSGTVVAAEKGTGSMDAHTSMAGPNMDGSDGHAGLDPMLPNLCSGHCQFGQQAADHTPAPAVSPALLSALYTLPAADGSSAYGARRARYRESPPGAGDPPHSILHCCFRD